MSRITLSISDRDHSAIRLLALYRNESMLSLIRDALQQYLEREGAYALEIRPSALDDSSSNSSST